MAMTGGCLCGAVRYEVASAPAFAGHCYCTDCRRSSGTGHSTVVGVAEADLKLTGELKGYTSTADSGAAVTRYFCPTCGSGIYSKGARPGMVVLKAGSLDDPETMKPMAALYVARAPSWDRPAEGLMMFEAMPPG